MGVLSCISDIKVLLNKIKLNFIFKFSKMRRGKPAIHKLYGVDISINAGNFAYFAPL